MTDNNELKVTHNQQDQRFETPLGDGMGMLIYDIEGDVMDMLSVNVPTEFRDRGIATQITRAAMDYAREMGYKVVPTCPFVQVFLRRNADYADLVVRSA